MAMPMFGSELLPAHQPRTSSGAELACSGHFEIRGTLERGLSG